jgi:hypothetical protein
MTVPYLIHEQNTLNYDIIKETFYENRHIGIYN